MTAATTVRRALRPRHVHFAANYLWIVDETQPVAALLEPDTHEVQKIVEWSALPARPPGTRAGEIVSDDHGLWVQSHSEGPLVRVTPNGIEHAENTEHHVLLCAGPTGAWAVSLPHKRNDVARTRDTRPQRNPVPRPELLLAPPGGGVRLFRVEDVLAAVDFDEAALILGVEHAPWTRVPRTSDRGKIVPDEYVLQYSRSWLRVPFDQPIPDVITRQKYLSSRPAPDVGTSWQTSEYADVSYNQAHRRKRALGDGVSWYWGERNFHSSTTVVKAFRRDAIVPSRVLELDGYRVAGGAAGGGKLWLIAAPEAIGGGDRQLLSCDIDDATVRRVETVHDVDISSHCWPIGPEPLDHESYVRYCVRRLDGYTFSDAVSNVRARYVGQWPDGRMHLSFSHERFPTLTLVARLNMYDEQGERLEDIMKYVPQLLMEQDGVNAYPPVSQAVDGVLYV
ncbi:MAG: hypothetical protein WBG14_17150 [Rhodococcus sp. (in: high G+C Gram-positive bacteria)]